MARDVGVMAEEEEQTSCLLSRPDDNTASESYHHCDPLPGSEYSDTRIFLAIAFSWLASFLAALGKISLMSNLDQLAVLLTINADSTITSTLSATIAAEFGSLAIISWLGSAYLIALAVVQPLSGKLTDIYGRRAGLIFCAILFAIGNTLCGLPGSMKTVAILGRIVAGVGAEGLNSIGTFIGNDLVPLRRRGMWQGFGNIVYAAGIGLGGVFGGGISSVWGWHWAFLILLPLTLLCALGLWAFVPGPGEGKQESALARLRRVDSLGSLILILALALLLGALNTETEDGSASIKTIAIMVPVSAALLALYVFVELGWAREPIIPVGILQNRTVACACLACWFGSMAMFSMMFYVPLYFQLKGFNVNQVGLLLLPEPIAAASGSFGSGIMMQVTGTYGVLKVVVLFVFLAGPAGYSFCSLETSILLPGIYLFFNGLGFGGLVTVMLICLLASVESEMQAIATAVQYAFRASGATIGISISGMVLRQVLVLRMSTDTPYSSIGQTLKDCHLHDQSTGRCPQEVLQAYMHALHAVFLVALAFGTAAFTSGFFTRSFNLSSTLNREDVL
jgi:MFS family permease